MASGHAVDAPSLSLWVGEIMPESESPIRDAHYSSMEFPDDSEPFSNP